MAQAGDTITYTANAGSKISEDVSGVDLATVDYLNGPSNSRDDGFAGGRVENAEIDVSGRDTLYLWVGESDTIGRYDANTAGRTGGSTEVSFDSRQQDDGESDLPFLVGAGGAGLDSITAFGAARGGTGSTGGAGTAPPQGGGESSGFDGEGAIDDQNRGLVSGGTTITGGGAGGKGENGEIRISYKSTLSPPDPPSNLTAEVQ